MKGVITMFNQVILIGRLTHDPIIKKTDTGKKVTDITIAVARAFKNMDGIYETDFISCTLWQATAEMISEHCKKGSMIAVRGRLQVKKYQVNEERELNMLDFVGEKVTYLSNSQKLKPSCPDETEEDN